VPAIYTLLSAALVYVAILSLFGRRMWCSRWVISLGDFSLAVAFGMLALVTAGVFEHGQYAMITRGGFIGFGLSLLALIIQYWRDAWRAR
jgi:hypothetical protein